MYLYISLLQLNFFFMAKVKFSALISEMRNKLNGSVFSKNRGGNYLRNKVTPVNPQSIAQTAKRSAFGALSSMFRTLGAAGVAAWNEAAPSFPYVDIFGDTKTLSGLQLFVKLNNNLSQIGVPSISEPPEPTDVGGFSELVVANAAATDMELGVQIVGDFTNKRIVVEATKGSSVGVSYFKNAYRQIGVIAPTGATMVLNVTGIYQSKFGVITPGTKASFRLHLVDVNTGQASPATAAAAVFV